MPSEHPVQRTEALLSVSVLRELIRGARGGFAPDHVARGLRYRDHEPVEEEAAEIAEVLTGLIAAARERLHASGLEPEFDETEIPPQLPKREREYIANLSTLLGVLTMALVVAGRHDDARLAGLEGVAWARTARDHAQQSQRWHVIGAVYERTGAFEDAGVAMERELAAASASKDRDVMLEALSHQSAGVLSKWKLEEAEEVLRAMREILDGDLPDDLRTWHYGQYLLNEARLRLCRLQYTEAISHLREALHWSSAEAKPYTRSAILSHLGVIYLRLSQFQQAIECQHEVVRVAGAVGSDMIRAWGYLRLADAEMALREFEKAHETLERACECTPKGPAELRWSIDSKRVQVLSALERFDEAAELGAATLVSIGEYQHSNVGMVARLRLAEVEERRGNDGEAEGHYRRALAIASALYPQRAPEVQIHLAKLLIRMERDAEAEALLGDDAGKDALNPGDRLVALRLHAEIAERRGDFRAVVEYERRAFDVERSILERRNEESLRNVRIMAEADLLERQAVLERERRRRAERDLADTMVELGDRKRRVVSIQQQLRRALAGTGVEHDESAVMILRQTLVSLREGTRSTETAQPLMTGLDEDFIERLRERWPGLTPKQERLCGLIRAGMSAKEICTLMNLQTEGLKAQRKRLRVRMGLAADERLEAVLAEV